MSDIVEIKVPDIGDFADVPVIEVLIKPGDTIAKNDSLVVLESDKASMEVPSTVDGIVKTVAMKIGDKVTQGALIATVQVTSATASTSIAPPPAPPAPTSVIPSAVEGPPPTSAPVAVVSPVPQQTGIIHASPSVRRLARERGISLSLLRASGPNGRITLEDLQTPAGPFAGLPAWPKVDFAQYGEIERKPLSRIKKLSGPNLHRNWLQIPHITNYDEADITALEKFRVEINEKKKKKGVKLTLLAFLVKAAVATLEEFPDFNSSLDGDALVLKKYYNIGFAADTPNGLMVPVIKNANTKGLVEIAHESAELAAKAREGKLGLGDMQGGTFTISSIGGIGGTQFTQIVNAPEVAILGATRAAIKPVWNGKKFTPRLILPISLSYDHRVIDGAAAARFLVYLAGILRDFRRSAL